ncbi:hypothetical protein JOF56_002103 [Kibdelosporangium banguiense]|uniref:Uncharacterized protein n=1 Tax=Kibdelosporangium banguiense TaxID=1365924 RepID=A0ABS4TBD9_9PSEU|nr:hypothetical protein [Kibdelosporangium banguiense]MBP2321718.1 hypothetical protein [Kibdelosporangium banguiense]
MDELEDSLKRLFRDSRLDIQVAPGADSAVVSGARRVRRRRIAMISAAGVMSLAVLAGGTFLLARPAPQQNQVANQPTDLPLVTATSPTSATDTPKDVPAAPSVAPSSTTTSVTTPRSRPVEQAPGTPTVVASFGPTTYGPFRLGMTDAQLTATSGIETEPMSDSASCFRYRVSGTPEIAALTVSKRYGLVAITVNASAQTPQNITIGSTEAQVRAAYGATITTTVPGNTSANFQFRYTDGKVSEMTLASKTQDCG